MKAKQHMRFDRADHRALRGSQLMDVIASEYMRFDGNADDASIHFARELDFIKAKTYDKLNPQLTALMHFPKTNDVDPGAEETTYYSYENTGYAKIISNYATDLPRVDLKGKPTTIPLRSLGDSYGYSYQELRASLLANKNLDARKATSARWAIESLMNQIAWAGDKDSGMMGLLSEWNDIPTFTLPAGANGSTDWRGGKTVDEVLNDIGLMHAFISDLTDGVEQPDTLMIDNGTYLKWSTTRVPDTSTTMLAFVKEKVETIKDIIKAPELAGTNPDINPYGENVAVLFTNDEEKLALEIASPFKQFPVQAKGLEMEILCEARIAGLQIFYPFSALIAVGV